MNMSQGDYEAPTRAEQPPASTPADDYPLPGAPVQEFPDEAYAEVLPIPVYDVSPAREPEIIAWSSGHTHLGESADLCQQLTGARRGRKRFVIWNEGTGAVYIGPTRAVGSNTPGMYAKLPVMNNDRLVLEHNSEIWVAVMPGDKADISYFEEYVVEMGPQGVTATE